MEWFQSNWSDPWEIESEKMGGNPQVRPCHWSINPTRQLEPSQVNLVHPSTTFGGRIIQPKNLMSAPAALLLRMYLFRGEKPDPLLNTFNIFEIWGIVWEPEQLCLLTSWTRKGPGNYSVPQNRRFWHPSTGHGQTFITLFQQTFTENFSPKD